MSARKLIEALSLSPHPEGGYYRETFRADESVETKRGPRAAGTAILYLLAGEERSRFHRIDADEVWFFHQGGPLDIYSLKPDGGAIVQTLSADNPQVIIPKGDWFGAKTRSLQDYCLCSCAVMPGFEFSGFEMASRGELLAGWPEAREWIETLSAPE